MSLFTQFKFYFPQIFRADRNDRSDRNDRNDRNDTIIKKQPRNNSIKKKSKSVKNNKINNKIYQPHGKALSKLVDDISERTPPEEKVLGIIEVLKRHPEKEGEIMAKYGSLLTKYKHVYTDKSAYSKKKRSRRKRRNSKKNH